MAEQKRPALGKGLSALIPDAPDRAPGVLEIEVDRIAPNPQQPRLHMDDARLEELAQSIRAHGVIQPIVVRRVGDRYFIIAGERRWRAAQLAGLTRLPAVVREKADEGERNILEMALIENIQREDLNPIEEATAYRRLVEEFQLTQDAIASAVGKDRSTVANTLRLLRLPQELQDEVTTGRLTMGHARALLALPGESAQRELGRDILARNLSVRETESLVKRALETRAEPEGSAPRAPKTSDKPDVHTRDAEDRLKLLLGTRVRIVRRGGRGRIEIEFASEDELIRIFEAITEN
jgi:ParB family transcriptional regulator, chromosome partitioning protein